MKPKSYHLTVEQFPVPKQALLDPSTATQCPKHTLTPAIPLIPSQKASECIVVIPTYNERENIAALIERLRTLPEPVDILVVDDNSPDGTASEVRRLRQRHDGVYLLQRQAKTGLGSAYKEGFAFALAHGWPYICQMDADFSHDSNDVPRLLSLCRNGADVAIGSRYVAGGKIEGWPLNRWLLSKTANFVARMMLNSPISDMTAGFKCFRREALERIDLATIASEGYIFQVEMNHRAGQEHLRIGQIPICFTDRKKGISKMGKQEAREGLSQLFRLAMC